jgi:hypothetical protein
MPEQDDLQELCERGQDELMRMEYLRAESTLAAAEQIAWDRKDFDTLSRLYMPLQEARRQRRQRCGEGVVALDLIAQSPTDEIDGRRIIENYPHGQLLVAGWGMIGPAMKVRELQRQHQLYVETFLAAVYPIGAGRAVVIVPLAQTPPPDRQPASVDDLIRLAPPHSLVYNADELPHGARKGTWQTYAEVMAMWERLHAPFLAAADMQVDPIRKMEGYRKTIVVDYACELAHQKLSDVAKSLSRKK